MLVRVDTDSFAEEYPVFLFDGVPALLRRIHTAGARLAIISSNTSKNVSTCLENGVNPEAHFLGGGEAELPPFEFMCASFRLLWLASSCNAT